MEKISNDIFSFRQEAENQLIQENFEIFHKLLSQAKELVEDGKCEAAAVYADLASAYAYRQHCGIFVSPELEYILAKIGKKTIKNNFFYAKRNSQIKQVKNILHVIDAVWKIGGHSRFLWRWIQQDKERSHSVVLIRQKGTNEKKGIGEIPTTLKEAVIDSNGQIYVLDQGIGSIVSWAKRLREIAASADIVVLHTLEEIVPCIAFANKEQSPPILLVNHSDERFWTGANIIDVLVNLRESGMHLAQKRRGISAEKNVILPTILEPTIRNFSRIQAKQKLGIPEDSILLLSIARQTKYTTIDGITFADAHVPLLEKHQQVFLVVIGPGNSEDWSAAIQQTQGRIKVLGQTEKVAIFYQAADIYVDSFPWVSITSLLEAGSYELPLVSRYPYSDDLEIIGADAPGLTGNLIRVPNIQEYTAVLSKLVEDEAFRLNLGKATKQKIVDTHIGRNWQRSLENIYLCATNLPNSTEILDPIAPNFFGELDELDIVLSRVFRNSFHDRSLEISNMLKARVPLMPFEHRLALCIQLLKNRELRKIELSFLLPWWLYWRIQELYSRLRTYTYNIKLLFIRLTHSSKKPF